MQGQQWSSIYIAPRDPAQYVRRAPGRRAMPQTQWSSIYIAPRDPALCQKKAHPSTGAPNATNQLQNHLFWFHSHGQGETSDPGASSAWREGALPMPGHKLPAFLGMVRTPAVRLPEHMTVPPIAANKQKDTHERYNKSSCLDNVKPFSLLLSSTKCCPVTPQHHSEL